MSDDSTLGTCPKIGRYSPISLSCCCPEDAEVETTSCSLYQFSSSLCHVRLFFFAVGRRNCLQKVDRETFSIRFLWKLFTFPLVLPRKPPSKLPHLHTFQLSPWTPTNLVIVVVVVVIGLENCNQHINANLQDPSAGLPAVKCDIHSSALGIQWSFTDVHLEKMVQL